MALCKWTPQEEHLCKLLLPTNSHREIAEELTRRHDKTLKGFPSERSEDAVRRKCEREGWEASDFSTYTEQENPVQDQWKTITEIAKKHRDASVCNTRGVIPKEKITTKILSLSDIHFPLAETRYIEQALADHSDSDIVVLNGDILEGYIFSTFEKHKNIAALDEYRAAFAFVELLAQHFPKVVLVDGNHDVRVSKAIKTAGFPKEASQVLRPNLIARIANGEKLDSSGMLVDRLDFKNVLYQENESWYVRIGNTLFIHPHGSASGGPGGMVRKHAIRFNTRYNPGEIDSIVCGHTHQIYKGIVNNQLLIEQGCLAGFLKYSWTPKAEFLTNAQNGYAVIYQDAQGNTDFNRSGPVYLGEVLPPKKSLI